MIHVGKELEIGELRNIWDVAHTHEAPHKEKIEEQVENRPILIYFYVMFVLIDHFFIILVLSG